MDVFFFEDEEYNGFWNKVSIKKELDCKLIYSKKIMKTKIRLYGDKTKYFHDQKIPKEGSNYTYLAVIIIDFVLTKYGNYYLQVFLKEYKYIEK